MTGTASRTVRSAEAADCILFLDMTKSTIQIPDRNSNNTNPRMFGMNPMEEEVEKESISEIHYYKEIKFNARFELKPLKGVYVVYNSDKYSLAS